MKMHLWRNRVIDVTVHIIFQSAYFMKTTSTSEFHPRRNWKWIACSVNADFGQNVNIGKFVYC